MADVHLPTTLTPLFPGLSRRLEVEAGTVAEALDKLEQQWPGIAASGFFHLCGSLHYEPARTQQRITHDQAHAAHQAEWSQV